MNDTPTDFAELVKQYVTLRDIKSTLKKKYEEDAAEIQEGMDKLSQALEARLDTVGVESLKTKYGSVSKTVKQVARVSDWMPFYKYVKEHDAFDMLYKRVNSKVVLEAFEETGELPDGTYTDNETVITVRKPTAKK